MRYIRGTVLVSLLIMIKQLLAATVMEGPDINALGPNCTMDDGKKGVCVPNFQCSFETNSVDPSASIDLRTRSCPNYLQICCLREELPGFTGAGDTLPQCGLSNPGALELKTKPGLIGSAEYGEFPWMVALFKSSAPDQAWSQGDYLGGGSIIHPSVVITAAHKVDGYYEQDVKCRAGEWDTSNTDETYETQERQVQKIITHDDFSRIQVYNNIALLVLKEPFVFREAPHMGIACLGNKMPPAGTACYTMGWGKGSDGNYATTLKKIQLPVMDSDVCQHTLRNTRLGSRFLLHPSLMCAGGLLGVDSCKGDGGSPLVCNIGVGKVTRYAIFGIVSSGVGCGKKNVPGVYVNIPYLYSWILDKMNEEKLESKAFVY